MKFFEDLVEFKLGNLLEVLKDIPDNTFDSCVTDPPYHLSTVKRFGGKDSAPAKYGKDGLYSRASRGFMGKDWDGGDVSFKPETWAEVLRVLKPGGHLLSFAAPRNQHRMICAIEDAGFEIRDCLMWIYGSGFPKSHNVSKAIDKHLGAEREKIKVPPRSETSGTFSGSMDTRPWIEKSREAGFHEVDADSPVTDEAKEWDGWGTALKPSYEPIVLARKPLSEASVAANVLRWGAGALNIEVSRVGSEKLGAKLAGQSKLGTFERYNMVTPEREGRWPANVIHDGSDEVKAGFPDTGKSTGGRIGNAGGGNVKNLPTGKHEKGDPGFGDSGSAARFFYCAKASKAERAGSQHPTVKPLKLMKYLVDLVTPSGGYVLDPFAGSGTTGEAAAQNNRRAFLIDLDESTATDLANRQSRSFIEK